MYIIGAPMKVAKWGNSLAVRLPKDVVEKLGLKENDEVRIETSGDAQTLTIERDSEQARREAALNVLRQFRGMMPADFKFNRDEANER
jgi:antitoxin MazE